MKVQKEYQYFGSSVGRFVSSEPKQVTVSARPGRRIPRIGAGIVVAIAACFAILAHNVSVTPSADDLEIFDRIIGARRFSSSAGNFEQEIRTISAVQRFVLRSAPVDSGLPIDQARGALEVITAGRGLCYDRSRAIEQLLRAGGFRVRHVFVLAPSQPAASATWALLLRKGTISHALSEVKTTRGWVLVDSNIPWLGIDERGYPLGLATLESRLRSREDGVRSPSYIFERNHLTVYGLYSRNGHFFPPYDGIPNTNYGELLDNFVGN